MSELSNRDEFLIHMDDAFWNNISRAENLTWTMIAVYGALIAGVGLAEQTITAIGAAFVLIVFGYVGSCLSASSNLWYRRNLTLIGRIETQFLNENDYGFLLPPSYKKPRRFWTADYWTLLMFTYPSVSVGLSAAMLVADAPKDPMIVTINAVFSIITVAVLGFGVTASYVSIQNHNYAKFLAESGKQSA